MERESITGIKVGNVVIAKTIDLRKMTVLIGLMTSLSLGHNIVGRKIGLINLGKSCFMNSIIYFVKHFTEGMYCNDIHPKCIIGDARKTVHAQEPVEMEVYL